METFLFLLTVTVVPLIVNKTTERGRLEFVHRWLREIWTGLLVVCSYYVLDKPFLRRFAMTQYQRDGRISYVVIFLLGGALLCLYWWSTGLMLKESSEKNQPPASETGKPRDTGRRTTFYSPPPGFTLDLPKGTADLTFKSSPLLTQKTRTRIKRDITRFRKYLVGLGIPVPLEFPPISVDMSDNTSGMQTPPQLPTYRGTVSIGKKVIQDPTQATSVYGDYVFKMQFEKVLNNLDDILRTMVIEKSMVNYYNWRFWDKRPAQALDIYAGGVLWTIREKFGKEFTDQLVTYTFQSMLDDPNEGASGQDFDLYFCRKLKIGDSVIDGGDKWPQIAEILRKDGRPVDKI
jgi:hypothetical protein